MRVEDRMVDAATVRRARQMMTGAADDWRLPAAAVLAGFVVHATVRAAARRRAHAAWVDTTGSCRGVGGARGARGEGRRAPPRVGLPRWHVPARRSSRAAAAAGLANGTAADALDYDDMCPSASPTRAGRS